MAGPRRDEMNRELRHLCDCLAAAAGLLDRLPAGTVDWERWLALAAEHKVSALLFNRFRRAPPWPEAVHRELASRYAASAYMNGLRVREQVALLRALAPVAEVIALKGFALLFTLYGEAAERDMADLDLLAAGEREAESLAVALRERGYVPKREMAGHHHLSPHAHLSGRLTVEIHTNLTGPFLPSVAMDHIWARRESIPLPDGGTVNILCLPHRLFHQALHAVKDPIESPLLRNLFEIAWMASRLTPEDWSAFDEFGELSGRRATALRALALAREWFPFSAPVFPTPRRSTIEWCARRRLNWIGEPTSAAEQFLRHLAVKHFDRMPAGRLRIDLPHLLGVAVSSVWKAVRLRIRTWLAPWSRLPVRRIPLAEREFRDAIALLRPSNGQVYVLRGAAAAAWRASSAMKSPRQVVRHTVDAGFSAREARAAIRRLTAEDLLLNASAKTAGAPWEPSI
ncbi:MAG: nucleotidyltransferase family protein [Kiritimatiellae bacterium]|nr:nucleotidyltransferase family protein [Kiritimatiellia bacterium]MDW8458043.1 nucleotidyltransferase family protein [Verrucomicrobiota bacterium]